jgi:hypothetical protein
VIDLIAGYNVGLGRQICCSPGEVIEPGECAKDGGIRTMSWVPIGVIIVAILFGSALLTMVIARFLPDHQLSPETKSVVSVSMAVVGTLSALVLGLFISTANTFFNAKTQEVAQISADEIGLDRLLRRYGPEAQDIRMLLHRYAEAKLQDLFRRTPIKSPFGERRDHIPCWRRCRTNPGAAAQERYPTLAAGAGAAAPGTMMASRWQLEPGGARKPVPLLALVMFWFITLFASFGLFAPPNITSIVAIFLGSVGVGGAIRMMTELQTPFSGLLHISSMPLAHALELMTR